MTHNHQNNVVETTDEKPQEDWMARRWRPAMGWLYMLVCACDFIVFPVLWSMTQAVYHIIPFVQWQPLTLQGAGLFHLAMGAVLGIAAYGRTKEKMAGAEQGGLGGGAFSQGFGQGAGTTYVPPGGQVNVSNQPGMGGGFNNGYNSGSAMGGSTYGSPQSGSYGSPSPFGSNNSTPPAFGSSTPPAFGSSNTSAPTLTTTPPPAFGGKPSGPTQSFPAL